MINKSELPPNWEVKKLGEVCFTTSGGTPSRKESKYYRGDIPWVKSGELDKGLILDTEEKISEEAVRNSSAKVFPKGTLLIALYGATIGKLAFLGVDASTNQAICGIFKSEFVESKFLYHFLFSKRPSLVKQSIGGAQPNISQGILKSLEIPLPPLAEQERIVAKIEELFSELDAGLESLKTAQAQLKTYRQAVLKYAFEGKLTVEWRNQQQIISASDLISQIKNEREAQIKSLGKKQKPIPVLTESEISDLAPLPDFWSWTRLGELVWSVKDGPHYSPKYQQSGIPFISGGNIRPEGIDFTKCKFISEELHEELSKRCKPEINDILYTKGGTTGIARVNTYDLNFNVWVHVAVLKAVKQVNPFYLQYALNSNHCYKQSQKYTHGVGNQDLGLTRMVLITVPICSLEEQQRVIEEIESRLSVCDKLEETITASLKQAESLRQSILKQAFEGKLVSMQKAADFKAV